MIEKILFLMAVIVTTTCLWNFIGLPAPEFLRFKSRSKNQAQAAKVEVSAVTAPEAQAVVTEVASPLIVRDLMDGKATLIVRYRLRKQACTAHLIIWSGDKRRRIQDSYYDLGVISADTVTDEVFQEFMRITMDKLDELRSAGQRKRRTRKKKEVAEVVVEKEAPAADIAVASSVVSEQQIQISAPAVEMDESPPESIQLKKFPSVYRGHIIESGMMPHSKRGEEFTTYGVRLRTPEGIEEGVYGANLRIALRDAKADVGDYVEILKIGRKTIEAGKAPMNLFKVAKIEMAA